MAFVNIGPKFTNVTKDSVWSHYLPAVSTGELRAEKVHAVSREGVTP